MMASSGGNIGFQIGGEATDFVIIVMNDAGAKGLLNNKVKLGADASVAAGPVTVDHPVDVPRRIERPGVLESAMPTASCVSLCESCGLMMNPDSKVGARGGNT